MTVNLNQHCRVRLTKHGRKILIASWRYDPVRTLGDAVRDCNICHPGWLDGETRFILWDLMRIFGPHMAIGGALVFRRNKVIIEDS